MKKCCLFLSLILLSCGIVIAHCCDCYDECDYYDCCGCYGGYYYAPPRYQNMRGYRIYTSYYPVTRVSVNVRSHGSYRRPPIHRPSRPYPVSRLPHHPGGHPHHNAGRHPNHSTIHSHHGAHTSYSPVRYHH